MRHSTWTWAGGSGTLRRFLVVAQRLEALLRMREENARLCYFLNRIHRDIHMLPEAEEPCLDLKNLVRHDRGRWIRRLVGPMNLRDCAYFAAGNVADAHPGLNPSNTWACHNAPP